MGDTGISATAGIIAKILRCRIEDVHLHAAVGSLPGWDSIAHMNIILTIEERLGRHLKAEEIATLETVRCFDLLFVASEDGRGDDQ